MPLPIYITHDGNIARAKINLQQSHIQTASMERLVADEVERAHLDCELCRASSREPKTESLPRPPDTVTPPSEITSAQSPPSVPGREQQAREPASELERIRKGSSADMLEILVRYLRNALDLNTAVGERIMP